MIFAFLFLQRFMIKNVELLAPAGSMDGLKAAIAFGADAVYMGGVKHNARINAKNFDTTEIEQAIKYARLRGKKVYITLNTLLFEDELDGVVEYVNSLSDMGACAIILQDLGVAKIIAKECTIPIHASTQMGIHNLDGCRFIEKMGFERAILSRETPLSEIKHIRINSTMELETFVHGALCGCFSGQCYFSYLRGGRSGNRGECAQPCRLEYKDNGHPLSTKDLMALELIPQLIDAGISSFKIEGRMKRPAYAGIVTDVYRKAIDLAMNDVSIPVEKYKEELIKIYNRGGFTKGYYLDNKNIFGSGRPNHMGEKVGVVTAVKKNKLEINTDKMIHVYDGLSFGKAGMEISDLYEKGTRVDEGKGQLSFSCILKGVKAGDEVYRTTDRRQLEAVEKKVTDDKIQIPVKARCEIDEYATIELTAFGKTAIAKSANPMQPAKTRGVTKEDVEKCVSKLGDTCFVLDELETNVKEGLFIAVSELNGLRRQCVEKLEKLLVKGNVRERVQFIEEPQPKLDSIKKVCIGIDCKERPVDCDVFLVYPKKIEYGKGDADGIVLPAVAFEEDLKKIEEAIGSEDIVVCNNVGQLERFKGRCRLWGGLGMNCTNSECASLLYGLGCEAVIGSIEAGVKGTLKIKSGPIPAMTFVACPKKASVGCEKCKKESLTGTRKRDFTCVELKNTYAFLLSDYKSDFGQVEYI